MPHNLCSAMLVLALLLNSDSAICYEDDYEGRLFLATSPVQGGVFKKKGFIAVCGNGNEVWYEQVTEEESRQRSQERILFLYDVREIVGEINANCFTELGNFIKCTPESIANDLENGTLTCMINRFNEPVFSFTDGVQDCLSGASNLIKEYAVACISISALITGLVASIAYKLHRKNCELSSDIENLRGQ